MILKKKKVIVLLSAIFLAGFFLFPSFSFFTIQIASGADDVSDAENSIEKTEKQLKEEQEKKARYESDVQRLQGAVNSTQSVINQTVNVIETAEETIARKEGEIKKIEDTIEKQKEILTRLIQEAYYNYNRPLFYATISDDNIAETFAMRDHLSGLKKKVVVMMDEIKQSQQELENEKGELQEKKQEHEEILEEKQDEKNTLVNEKEFFEDKVEEKEVVIAKLQKKLVALQSDLTKLTGKSFNAKDIQGAVEFASDHTRVPKGVLYGFLGAETHFNANTGQCTYKQVKKDAIDLWYGTSSKWKASRDLLERRYDIFEDIVGELGYSKSKKVSCTPRSYRGQGGAMGVAQFMSDTWMGYESKIAAITGHNSPDPWNLIDGVLAMALKFEKAGATSDKKSVIKQASINYLGGFNQNYYEDIIYWSENYKSLFP